ncbi:carboxypeptidase-like regulatory domain-containing protein [Candidatus Cloacimonadota bacterium]
MKKLILSLAVALLLGSVLMAGTVQGYVTDAETGEPIDNAKVHFTTNDGRHIHFDAYTDENGFFSRDIPNDTYNCRALKSTEYRVFLIEAVVVEEGITTIDFQLEPTTGSPKNNGF